MHGLAAIPLTDGQTNRIPEFNTSLLGRDKNTLYFIIMFSKIYCKHNSFLLKLIFLFSNLTLILSYNVDVDSHI
jgi:hypothetical protein